MLGTPDYSEVMSGPKGPDEKWLGWAWMYYLSKRSKATNLNDPRVEIFFDTSYRATWIVPTGVPGAHEIGGVRERCS